MGLFSRAMRDSKLLAPELSEAEAMGAEAARFEELLLQVWTAAHDCDCRSQHAAGRHGARGSCSRSGSKFVFLPWKKWKYSWEAGEVLWGFKQTTPPRLQDVFCHRPLRSSSKPRLPGQNLHRSSLSRVRETGTCGWGE